MDRFIQFKKGTSEEFSSKIDEKISMLFIDGDHTSNMVKKDFHSWGNKIEQGDISHFMMRCLKALLKLY